MRRVAISWGDPTRFAGLPAQWARVIVAGLLLLAAWGMASSPAPPSGRPGAGDADLYRAVVERVAQGEAYHAAAAAEQRQRGYPIRPFTAIRPPALAEFASLVGPDAADMAMKLLGVAAALALGMRFFRELRSPVREIALGLAASSLGLLAMPSMWVWHELWSGLLIMLALALRTDRRWGAAVLFGLLAALVRELAIPFLPLMAIAAWRSGRQHEAAAWAGALLIVLVALCWHAGRASAVFRPGDASSPGWLAFGGWRFALVLARHSVLLLALPPFVTAIALPLALIGWFGWKNGFALRTTWMLAIWLGAFLIVGRPDNDYWGFLLAPALPIGLALAPAALRDLTAAAGFGWRRS